MGEARDDLVGDGAASPPDARPAWLRHPPPPTAPPPPPPAGPTGPRPARTSLRPVLAAVGAVLAVVALGAAAWLLLPEGGDGDASPPPPTAAPTPPALTPRPRIPAGTDPLEGALLVPGDVAVDAVGQRDGPLLPVSTSALADKDLSPACRQYYEAVGDGHDPTALGRFVGSQTIAAPGIDQVTTHALWRDAGGTDALDVYRFMAAACAEIPLDGGAIWFRLGDAPEVGDERVLLEYGLAAPNGDELVIARALAWRRGDAVSTLAVMWTLADTSDPEPPTEEQLADLAELADGRMADVLG